MMTGSYPTSAHFKPALASPAGPTSDPAGSAEQGVRTRQVNHDKNEADTGIDIDIIHGLGTESPDTHSKNRTDVYGGARFRPHTICLPSRQPLSSRPILFIASCLGGLILIQAMVIAAQPKSKTMNDLLRVESNATGSTAWPSDCAILALYQSIRPG
ncbi:hypothetical protein DL770_008304 [Monosporascus sp. CRB-9-2]|nr:hypothetical protein DL770_008304 [Monosporascus sp. CRB-9-2]